MSVGFHDRIQSSKPIIYLFYDALQKNLFYKGAGALGLSCPLSKKENKKLTSNTCINIQQPLEVPPAKGNASDFMTRCLFLF
jgi:hypothetical protein